jgi:hypothetical protein
LTIAKEQAIFSPNSKIISCSYRKGIKLLQQNLLPSYNGHISSKAALLAETLSIFDFLAKGGSIADVRNQVTETNLLSKQSGSTRQTIWNAINRRYFSGRTEESVDLLVHLIASQLSIQSRQLILLYEFCHAEPLLYDFVVEVLFELYQAGRSSIEKADIFSWLEKKYIEGHLEIQGWTPQTKDKIASNLLSIARDFGLLTGVQRKSFQRVYIPLSSFIYALYEQQRQGLNGRNLIESRAFRIFLLDKSDVILLLGEAASQNLVKFRHTGDIYELTLTCTNLKEAMDSVVTNKIP